MRIFPSLTILVAALALAACTPSSTTKPGEQTASSGADAGANAARAVTTPVQTAPVAVVVPPPQPDPLAALDDPRSVLATRVFYFDFDSSEVRGEFQNAIAAHAKFLVQNPGVKVRIEGDCDERGTREYNIGLGDRRAQAVRRLLMFQGVRAEQLTTVSYGEERPATDGHDEDAWKQNRRVELAYAR